MKTQALFAAASAVAAGSFFSALLLAPLAALHAAEARHHLKTIIAE